MIYDQNDDFSLSDTIPYQPFLHDHHPNTPIKADFSVDTLAGLVNEKTFRFFNQSIGSVDSISWDFGDGTISNDTNPEHLYTEAGNYDVTLFIKNDLYEDSFTLSNLMVNPFLVDLGEDESIVCGDSIILDPQSNYNGTGELTYNWSPTTGLSDPTSKNPVVQTTETTDYVLETITPSGCSAFDTITVSVVPLSVDVGQDQSIVCGESITLQEPQSNYTGIDELIYSWSPTIGLSDPNSKNPVVEATETTDYILEITSANGCSAFDTITVSVVPLTVDVGEDQSIVCGESINLQDPQSNYMGTDELIYNWSPATGLSDPNSKNPVVQISETIDYVLEIMTSNGCTAYDSITVSPSVANINPMICNVTVNEENQNQVFISTVESMEIDSFFVYRETSVTGDFELIGTQPRDSLVFVDSESEATVQSNTYKIAALDNCGFITDLSEPHKSIHLTLSKGTENDWNLMWEPYLGKNVSSYNIYRGSSDSELNLIHTLSGSHTSYTDKNVSASDVYYQIEMLSAESEARSNNGTGSLNECASSRSNIAYSEMVLSNNNGIESSQFYLYPNPVKDKVNIHFPKMDDVLSISIIDIYGKSVKELNGTTNIIDTSNLKDGMYYVVINTQGSRYAKKLIKSSKP